MGIPSKVNGTRSAPSVSRWRRELRSGAALSELEVARPLSENSAIFFQEIINDGLHEVLSAFQLRLNQFGQALFNQYFGMSQAA